MISDWFGVFPALPSQYFERLLFSDLLYPGLNSLEGFCDWEDRFCIVTSQPFIAGRHLSRNRRFHEIPRVRASLRGDLVS